MEQEEDLMETLEYTPAVMKQALRLYKKWAKSSAGDLDRLHKDDPETLVNEMYVTEHKRDPLLCEVLTEVIWVKKSEHIPADAHAVALANLRYEDAI